MRLPADAALIVLASGEATEPEAVAALRGAWETEGLPVFEAQAKQAFGEDGLEARLDALGVTTLVICGIAAPEAASEAIRGAASLGFRLFVVAEACADGLDLRGLAPDAARIASLEITLQASQGANFRRRWRAARDRGG